MMMLNEPLPLVYLASPEPRCSEIGMSPGTVVRLCQRSRGGCRLHDGSTWEALRRLAFLFSIRFVIWSVWPGLSLVVQWENQSVQPADWLLTGIPE